MSQQEVLTLLSKVNTLDFEKIRLFGSFATSKAHTIIDIVDIINIRLLPTKAISLSLLLHVDNSSR